MKQTISRLCVASALAWLLAAPALAGESRTIEKIRQSGEITLGHRVTSAPFSFIDDNKQVQGYAHELMLMAVDDIKTQLKLPELKIKLVELTITNRYQMIESGTVDLECGPTTHTLEREKRVGFSTSYFVNSTKLLVRNKSGIRGLEDLRGKTVTAVAAGTSEIYLRRANEEQNLGLNILAATANDEAFRAMETGRALAYMQDDSILFARKAYSKNPGDWQILPKTYRIEVAACMLSKDDPEFKALVDAALTRFLKSPKGQAHYKRWFLGPMPGKGVNMNMPMSAAMKALLKDPNDRVPE